MKRPLHLLLALSLLSNAVLGWMAFRFEAYQAAIPTPSTDEQVRRTPPAEPVLLDWRSLEAPDFATYIANLRRAGCPEATIRHLIELELHAVFEARRQNPTAEPSAPFSAADEAATLAALLGAEESELPVASLASSTAADQVTTTPPSIPAAFLVGNASNDAVLRDGTLSVLPTDASLAPETLQTLADMRRQFGDQVTTGSSDPSSREYYRLWLKAQRQSDDYFASLYGGDHFINVQQQANLQRAQSGADHAAQVTKSSN